jgi:hypothetical protein
MFKVCLFLKIMFSSAILIGGAAYASDSKLSQQSVKSTNSVVHYPGTGGVVISSGRDGTNNYLKSVCVAPPAQVAQAEAMKAISNISASMNSNNSIPDGPTAQLDANLAASRAYEATTTISRIYEQNERTLLLQYSLYRLCEAHMNGMFEPYTSPLSDLIRQREAASQNSELVSALDARIKTVADIEIKIFGLEEKRKESINKLKDTKSKKSKDDVIALNKTIASIEVEIESLKSLYFINTYQKAFNEILKTAKELAEIDKERAIAESQAEKAKAEAEKTKAELEKEKLKANPPRPATSTASANPDEAKKKDEELALAKKQLEDLKQRIIDSSLNCIDCKKQ